MVAGTFQTKLLPSNFRRFTLVYCKGRGHFTPFICMCYWLHLQAGKRFSFFVLEGPPSLRSTRLLKVLNFHLWIFFWIPCFILLLISHFCLTWTLPMICSTSRHLFAILPSCFRTRWWAGVLWPCFRGRLSFDQVLYLSYDPSS